MSGLSQPALAIAPSGATGRHRTLAVVLAGFCAFLTLFMTQPLLPEFAVIFRASKVAVSLTVTGATIGVALAAPFIGTIADKLGRKKVIVVSAYALAAATLLAASATTLRMLVFWRFLQGICTPGVFAVTVAYIQEEWAGRGAGSATAAYVTGTVIGGLYSRVVSGFIASRLSWQMSFVMIGVTGALAATALFAWLPQESRFTSRKSQHSTRKAALDHLRNRRLLATFLAGFCLLFCLLGIFTYVTFYLAAPPFYLGPTALGSLFFVYLAGVAFTPKSGKAIDRYGQRITMASAVGISLLGTLITLSHNLTAVIAGLALVCSGVFIAQSCSNSYIGIAARHNTALAVGLYVTFYYIGGSIGSSVPGYLWSTGGWPACVVLFAVVQLITLAITLLGWEKRGARLPEASACDLPRG